PPSWKAGEGACYVKDMRWVSSMLGCAGLSLVVVACGGGSGEPITPSPSTPVPAEAEPEPSTTQSPDGAEPSATPADGGGRLAFVNCEEPRQKACTKEFRPVCAEVDTGIRCVTTPCPSSEKKTFGNACMACAEAAVIGYFPQACDQLGTDAAP
ncbi:MAG TPA: hypothetical protein VLC09_21770, partial [Polyangiaceae bacterium]|nr:hypothetical protein [Polyangiaceae bacterium]